MQLYPMLLEPIYKEKIWGGRTLESLGRNLPGDEATLIGESWEVADLGSTARSGGGGGAARSVIENGPLTGDTLTDLVARAPEALLGRAHSGAGGAFPLLVKYLDARQNLSVQVHPSAEYAATHPGAHVKSEAWYVVNAEPGAVIYKGIVAGTDRAGLERAIREKTVPDLLIEVPAHAGDCHYLPSGTCHALGGGIVVAEVQTPSDTTFRIFDWGRTDRELHVDAALACAELGPLDASRYEPGGSSRAGGVTTRELVASPYFEVDEWRTDAHGARGVRIDGPEVWMVIDGRIRLEAEGDDFAPVEVVRGRTVVLPASLGTVRPTWQERTVLLRVSVPRARAEV